MSGLSHVVCIRPCVIIWEELVKNPFPDPVDADFVFGFVRACRKNLLARF